MSEPSLRGLFAVVARLLSCVWLFVTQWTAARQAPLSSIVSRSLLRFMSFESMTLSNHLIFCCPSSFCLKSFPASGSFPVSRLFTSRLRGLVRDKEKEGAEWVTNQQEFGYRGWGEKRGMRVDVGRQLRNFLKPGVVYHGILTCLDYCHAAPSSLLSSL